MKLQATQVMIAFNIDGDREEELVTLLITLVRLFGAFWKGWGRLSGVIREALALWTDASEAARFTGTVLSIALTAWLYGLGVKI